MAQDSLRAVTSVHTLNHAPYLNIRAKSLSNLRDRLMIRRTSSFTWSKTRRESSSDVEQRGLYEENAYLNSRKSITRDLAFGPHEGKGPQNTHNSECVKALQQSHYAQIVLFAFVLVLGILVFVLRMKHYELDRRLRENYLRLYEDAGPKLLD